MKGKINLISFLLLVHTGALLANSPGRNHPQSHRAQLRNQLYTVTVEKDGSFTLVNRDNATRHFTGETVLTPV